MRRPRSGFSVIEAVIAIAIAAIGLSAILGLQQQLAKSQAKDEEALQRISVRSAALVLVRDINPMQKPAGRAIIGAGLNASWTSEVIMPPTRGLGFGGAPSAFNIGLYTVTVSIEDPNRVLLDRFMVERLGWERVQGDSLY